MSNSQDVDELTFDCEEHPIDVRPTAKYDFSAIKTQSDCFLSFREPKRIGFQLLHGAEHSRPPSSHGGRAKPGYPLFRRLDVDLCPSAKVDRE